MKRLEWPCGICGKPVVLYPDVAWQNAPSDKTPYISRGFGDHHFHQDCDAMIDRRYRSPKTGLLKP